MPLPQEKAVYTTDDIYALPDGQRAELIEGQIYNMAPPAYCLLLYCLLLLKEIL